MARKKNLLMDKDVTKNRVGIYPGTFDPLTNGHMDIIGRAVKVVDKLVVAVATNAGKEPLFSLEERVAMCRGGVADLNIERSVVIIEVVSFDTLLMDFVLEVGGAVIIRGLRAVSDFEYEFQMAGMNSRLNSNVETVFLMASESNQFISSRLVKEIGGLGGEIASFVPPNVLQQLKIKLRGSH